MISTVLYCTVLLPWRKNTRSLSYFCRTNSKRGSTNCSTLEPIRVTDATSVASEIIPAAPTLTLSSKLSLKKGRELWDRSPPTWAGSDTSCQRGTVPQREERGEEKGEDVRPGEGEEVTVDSQFSLRKPAFITHLILRSKQVSVRGGGERYDNCVCAQASSWCGEEGTGRGGGVERAAVEKTYQSGERGVGGAEKVPTQGRSGVTTPYTAAWWGVQDPSIRYCSTELPVSSVVLCWCRKINTRRRKKKKVQMKVNLNWK